MPTIILNEIECFDPRGVRDDMMLTLTTDEIESEQIWGPERMREGNRIDLRGRVAPIEYDDFARISLYEHDRVGRNDYFGTMSFFPGSRAGTGDHYFPGELNARYRINCTLRAEPATSPNCIISPRSLTCNDAQGARDEVTLYVNHQIILGPMHKMKKDWTVNFNDLEIHFRSTCEVRLKDTQGQDWSRSFLLRAGDYLIDRDIEHIFDVRGRGVTGDARYTFAYRMLA